MSTFEPAPALTCVPCPACPPPLCSISNAKFPLKSVSVNGNQLARATYNFWTLSAPLGQAPYTVIMEAVNGQTVTAVTDKMLAEHDLGVQFQEGGAPVQSAG
jgi:hypothetical protein